MKQHPLHRDGETRFNQPDFKTLNLHIRPVEESDAPALSVLRSDERVNRYLDREKITSLAAAQAFIKKIKEAVDAGTSFYWIICRTSDAALIGTICLWNFSADQGSAEIGYELHPDYQGRGYMQEAVECIIRFGFTERDLRIIEAMTHKDNLPSLKLLNRNGFTADPLQTNEENPDCVFYRLFR